MEVFPYPVSVDFSSFRGRLPSPGASRDPRVFRRGFPFRPVSFSNAAESRFADDVRVRRDRIRTCLNKVFCCCRRISRSGGRRRRRRRGGPREPAGGGVESGEIGAALLRGGPASVRPAAEDRQGRDQDGGERALRTPVSNRPGTSSEGSVAQRKITSGRFSLRRGCTLFVSFEAHDMLRKIGTIKCDPNTVSTFELYLTLKQDSSSWHSLLPQFLK